MRWERLFADLEAELEAADAAELHAEVAERTRAERARLRLVDRVRGNVGRPVQVDVVGAGTHAGDVAAVGADWLVVRAPSGADRLVRLPAVLAITGLTAASAPARETDVSARFTFTAMLRRLARDRTTVTVTLVDGTTRSGVLDAVGADVVDLVDRPPGDLVAARDALRTVRTIPTDAIALVREH